MFSKHSDFTVALALAAFVIASAAVPAAASGLRYGETVVAGGPDRFMEVRHVIMKGTNIAIGEKLGEIAKALGARPDPRGDTLLNRIQREYMVRNYPILHERMRGIAAAFGLDVEDDRCDFSSIMLFPTGPPGCSAVFYPGTHTANGHGTLSRNYDFTTGTISGRRPTAEAKEALLLTKHVYGFVPCHYLIADRSGESFT